MEKARDEQTDAKKQFASTLDEFKSLTNFNGGDLEGEYRKLNSSYEDCESEAADVTKRINGVDKVANAMFAEWQTEAGPVHGPVAEGVERGEAGREQAAVRRPAGGHAQERVGHAAGAGGRSRTGCCS